LVFERCCFAHREASIITVVREAPETDEEEEALIGGLAELAETLALLRERA
jgi:hypothetical protein